MRVGQISPYRIATAASRTAGAATAPGFALSGATGRTPAAAVAAPVVASALMPVGDPMERRREGARRGRAIIAALDALKLALLSGNPTDEALGQLALANGSIDAGDDPGLAAVLDAIGLRADVELAKSAMRRQTTDSAPPERG